MIKLLANEELITPSSEEISGVIRSTLDMEIEEKIDKRISEIEKRLKIESMYRDGVELLKKGDYKLAKHCFAEITGMDSNIKGAYLNKGVALGVLGEIKQEIGSYLMALDIDKTYDKALHNMKIAEEKLKKGREDNPK
jgi:tetratricopeptide (TPR) repeat protein